VNRVWILGCGPAGMFAAHAARQSGIPLSGIRILSKNRPSRMFGAQYLHAEIPGLVSEADAFDVDYQLRGVVDDYRGKVYGPNSTAITSPERLLGFHRAWDIRTAYARAWNQYSTRIEDAQLSPDAIEALAGNAGRRAIVVSSVPLPVLCQDPERHTFEVATIWAMGDAPELNQYAPVTVTPDTVVCNGEDSPRWYRASNIRGYRSVEWPDGRKPPVEGVARVSKPIRTNCDCTPRVLRVGRYGTWGKGVLSHHAYEDVLKALG